ncbi:hypothetical protein EPJ74_05795 [Brachyspira aalborgi]|uniref:Lipocalin-like domain-containing protein n=1 Tax=Brachyspira aalborgi TaxID=29522 RepID=A0A5C8GFQ7_9SPIR|nr:hypothetical protein [Brachyspira aalborgi]TXJ60714.1 hypothetical protein EPJ74_05795 [Brachyspira aalborgi]
METKRKTFNKIYKGSLLVVFLFIAIISCNKNPYNDNSRLLGTWENPKYSGETYIYDGITFTSSGSYKMKVKSIIWSSDASGIIYGRYTENTYNPSVVGKYYAVSFKDLTDTSISICGAFKGGKMAADSLVEAITEFTINNGYYSLYSSCKKVK